MIRFALLFLLSFLLFTSCHYTTDKRIKGNGNVTTQTRNVGSFTGVNTMGSIDVVLIPGSASSLQIKADQNLLEYIEVENDNGTLQVSTKDGYDLNPSSKIKVYATAPYFNEANVSGSGSIQSDGRISGSNTLHTKVSGSGTIVLDVDAPKVDANIMGSGSISLKGMTQEFAAGISGSGEVHSFELLSEHTDIEIAGSGDAEVFASKTLDASIAGSGDIKYKGNPAVKQSMAGAGSIHKVD